MATDTQDYSYMAGRMRYSVAQLADFAYAGLASECALLGYEVERSLDGGAKVLLGDDLTELFTELELAQGKTL